MNIRFLSRKVALDDDSITDILQSRKIRSILGVEADSDGYITPLSDRSSQSAPKPPIRTRKSRSRRRFRRTSLVAPKRSKSESLGRARRKRTPKRVRSLVNWFEKLAAKHQGTDPEETRMEVMGLEWKPGLHDIMEDRELNAALESFMSRLYCEENLLYLKELRDLRGRFGGGAAIGRAHLSLSMPPTFGSDLLQTFSASEPDMNQMSRSNSGFAADDEKEEDEAALSSLDKSVRATADMIDRDREELDELESVPTPAFSDERSVEYQMSGLFDEPRQRDAPTLSSVSFVRSHSADGVVSVESKEMEDSREDVDVSSLATIPPESAIAAGKRMWREFISQNAFHQVNLSFDTREGIRANIREISEMPHVTDATVVDIFIESQKEIEKLIRTDTLSKFYDSPEFIVIANSRPLHVAG